MSDENVGGLVEKWRGRCPVGDPEDEYPSGYDDALRHCAVELEAALSAHGQPVDYSPALHSVLSYIAYGECDEEGLHPGLFATVKEKIDKLRSKPVVDERINRAWKLVERWEQPTIDGDTLTKEERLRNMGFAAMLRAALGATP